MFYYRDVITNSPTSLSPLPHTSTSATHNPIHILHNTHAQSFTHTLYAYYTHTYIHPIHIPHTQTHTAHAPYTHTTHTYPIHIHICPIPYTGITYTHTRTVL